MTRIQKQRTWRALFEEFAPMDAKYTMCAQLPCLGIGFNKFALAMPLARVLPQVCTRIGFPFGGFAPPTH